MGFMKPLPFGELAAADIFYDEPRRGFGNDKCEVWMKVTGNDDFNAISNDGTRTVKFDDARTVEVVRKKIHFLDLRQGDQCSMVANLGIAYMVNTVLKVEDKDEYRHVTFARPMIQGDSFGTTCPSGKVHVENYTAMVRIGNYSRDDYYHLVGVDTSAIYHDVLGTLNCLDKYRLATFLLSLGSKQQLAELLCEDGLALRSMCIKAVYDDYINRREFLPEFPDRDDSAETKYIDELRAKEKLSKWEIKFLGVIHAKQAKL